MFEQISRNRVRALERVSKSRSDKSLIHLSAWATSLTDRECNWDFKSLTAASGLSRSSHVAEYPTSPFRAPKAFQRRPTSSDANFFAGASGFVPFGRSERTKTGPW